MAVYTLSDIYLDYFNSGGTLSKSEFKNIVQDFNIHVMNAIIHEGGTLNMACGLSKLSILRLKRNFKNLAVDWYESNKLKAKLLEQGKKLFDKATGLGEEWLVYHTDLHYYRFYWSKKFVKIPNKFVYRFEPTRGFKGNKEKLKEHLSANELNYTKYTDGSI